MDKMYHFQVFISLMQKLSVNKIFEEEKNTTTEIELKIKLNHSVKYQFVYSFISISFWMKTVQERNE